MLCTYKEKRGVVRILVSMSKRERGREGGGYVLCPRREVLGFL